MAALSRRWKMPAATLQPFQIEQKKPHWQTAAGELLTAAERGGIVMLAEIAMRQALGHGKPEPPRTPRKKAAKKYRIVR